MSTLDRHTTGADHLAWADAAGCIDADPDLFFPTNGADTGYARSICRACPVRRQCLDYALESGQKHGIWGGMTESQRRRLRRRTHPSNSVERTGPIQASPAQASPIQASPVQASPVQASPVQANPVQSGSAPVRHLQLVR